MVDFHKIMAIELVEQLEDFEKMQMEGVLVEEVLVFLDQSVSIIIEPSVNISK